METIMTPRYLFAGLGSDITLKSEYQDCPLVARAILGDFFEISDGYILIKKDCTIEMGTQFYCSTGYVVGDLAAVRFCNLTTGKEIAKTKMRIRRTNPWSNHSQMYAVSRVSAGDILAFQARNEWYNRGIIQSANQSTFVLCRVLIGW